VTATAGRQEFDGPESPDRSESPALPESPESPERPAGPELDEAVARLSLALGRLNRVVRRGDATGLGSGSISALATLVRCGPTRLGDLAAREGVTPPTLTRIVGGLEDLGFVVRQPDPDDRRATRVQATEAAEELVAGVGSARVAQLRARIDTLSQADVAILVRAVPVFEALATEQ
jgi:DNA-binding MarR family transcriptional regulator